MPYGLLYAGMYMVGGSSARVCVRVRVREWMYFVNWEWEGTFSSLVDSVARQG